MSRVSGRKPLGIAVLAATGFGLVVGSFALEVPGFVWLLAPLLAWACEGPRTSGSIRGAMLVGFGFGFGYAIPTMAWVAPAVERFSGLGPLVAHGAGVVAMISEALPTALACGVYAVVGIRQGFVMALALAASFTLVPMFAPWRPIALALPIAPIGALLGIGGATLADLLVLGPAGALFGDGRRASRGAIAVALVAIAVAVGSERLATIRAETDGLPTERIVAIQPDVSIARGLDRNERRARLDALADATARTAVLDPDVVVWPESAHPYVLDRDARSDLPPPHATGAIEAGALVVVGASTERDECHRWNGVVAFDARGRVVGMVDKRVRMPFADFIPVLEFVSARSRCRDLGRASRTALIQGRFGALTCYDEVFVGPSRDDARRGARYLVSFTNDAWFEGTRQMRLQARVARMRALENGLDLVRAVNIGGSEHIGADGAVLERLTPGRVGRLVVDVPVRTHAAPAVRFGVFVDAACVVALVVLYLRQRRGRSSGGGGR